MEVTPVKVIEVDGKPVRIDHHVFNPKEHTEWKANDQYDEHGVQRSETKMVTGEQSADGTVTKNEETFTTADVALLARITAMNPGSIQDGKNFFVVDATTGKKVNFGDDGQPLTSDDPNLVPIVDPKGYKSNKACWDAIMKLKTMANPAGGSSGAAA